MPTEILIKPGAQIQFADHAGDFSAATKTSLLRASPTPVTVQLSLVSLGVGNGRESAKVNLGATRAASYSFSCALEWLTVPTTGRVVKFYWAASPESVAADGNIQSIDGVDAAAPSGHSLLQELTDACDYIGAAVVSADFTPTVQTMRITRAFVPPEQWGILIVVNNTDVILEDDDVEMHVVMTPNIDEFQDA